MYWYRKHEKGVSCVAEMLKGLQSSSSAGLCLAVTPTFYQELPVVNKSKELLTLMSRVFLLHRNIDDL